MANDLRRQTTLDITNSIVSARRLQRVMRDAPRHKDVETVAYSIERAAFEQLGNFIEQGEKMRDAIDTMDSY